jgi:hypothetical protein
VRQALTSAEPPARKTRTAVKPSASMRMTSLRHAGKDSTSRGIDTVNVNGRLTEPTEKASPIPELQRTAAETDTTGRRAARCHRQAAFDGHEETRVEAAGGSVQRQP